MQDVWEVVYDEAPGARARGVRAPQDTEIQVSDVRTAVLQETRPEETPREEGSRGESAGSDCRTDC